MSLTYIPKTLRELVAFQAHYRCGYCLTAEQVVGTPMELDHLIPESHGGRTEQDNLWLACSMCNDHKGDRITVLDPVTEEMVRLFDPRRQRWQEHFRWSKQGLLVIGVTPVGRATVMALKLNRPTLVSARRLWVSAGWHPPKD